MTSRKSNHAIFCPIRLNAFPPFLPPPSPSPPALPIASAVNHNNIRPHLPVEQRLGTHKPRTTHQHDETFRETYSCTTTTVILRKKRPSRFSLSENDHPELNIYRLKTHKSQDFDSQNAEFEKDIVIPNQAALPTCARATKTTGQQHKHNSDSRQPVGKRHNNKRSVFQRYLM